MTAHVVIRYILAWTPFAVTVFCFIVLPVLLSKRRPE